MIKPIKDFDGYFVSDDGKIYCNLGKGYRGRERNRPRVPLYEVNPRVARNGYTRVYMRNTVTNKRMDRYIHRLVAEYFIPNPLNKNVVNHIDCDRSNNHYLNLEWMTTKENNEYTMKLKHLKRDEKTGRYYS